MEALSLPKEEEKEWLRQLGHTHLCHFDIILALLRPALLKLERLVLDMKARSFILYLEQIIRRVTSEESPFDIQPVFEALTFFSCELSNIRSPSFIASLLKLPCHPGNNWRRRIGIS